MDDLQLRIKWHIRQMDSSKEENEYKTCRQKEPVKNIWSKYSFSPWIFSRWRTILTLLHLDINWVSSLSYSNFHLVITLCLHLLWQRQCKMREIKLLLRKMSSYKFGNHIKNFILKTPRTNAYKQTQWKTKQNKKERTQYKQIAEILFQQGV